MAKSKDAKKPVDKELLERVNKAIVEAGYSQLNWLAEDMRIENSRVSEAVNGKNQKRLKEVIQFLVTNKGYEFTYFYPQRGRTVKDLLLEMESRIDDKIEELMRTVERLEEQLKNK